VESNQTLPLSFMQRNRFLRVTRALRTGRTPFQTLVPFGIEVRGDITDEQVALALAAVVRCHESLRTGFHLDASTDTVTPFVLDAGAVPTIRCQHLSAASEADRIAQLTARLVALCTGPMALDAPPLMRAVLCRFDPADAVLLIAVEHQVCDGRSADVIVDDLAKALRSPDADLPAALQYFEWIRWQQRTVNGAEGRRAMEFWRTYLDGTRPYPELGLPAPSGPVEGGAVAEVTDVLDAGEFARLRRAVGTAGSSPFMAMLAAVSVAWHRSSGASGASDAVVHCPCENREYKGADRVVGWLAHSLILRLRADRHASWRSTLRAARQSTLAALAHQAVPFAEVVKALQPEMHGTAVRQPRLFCTYEPGSSSAIEVPGGSIRKLPTTVPPNRADAGLSFVATETDGGLRVSVVYDPRAVRGDVAGTTHAGIVAGLRAMSEDLDLMIVTR
jgi:hypothetical protein